MKLKLPLGPILKYSKIVIWTFMVGVVIIVGVFIYRNMYIPLTRAVEVAELKQTVALVTVNRPLLETVLKNIQESATLPDVNWQEIRNPFQKIQPVIVPEEPLLNEPTTNENNQN